MKIDKKRIVDALRRQGLDSRADWIERELPDQVDTQQNAGLLATLRLNPADLVDEGAAPEG